MGEVRVPKQALYSAQTQRAVNNYAMSNLYMPRGFVRSMGLIKQAAANANHELGLLDQKQALAIS